jgi:hypothetical protein
VYGQEAVLLV